MSIILKILIYKQNVIQMLKNTFGILSGNCQSSKNRKWSGFTEICRF